MTSAASVGELEVSEKLMTIGAGTGDALSLRIRFKDFYILRAGQCDFTGLRVWPGAELLAAFLHACGRAGMLQDISGGAIELGAGVGLGGLVAGKFMQHVILTDRVPVLLDLMRENVSLNALDGKVSVAELDWGVQGATDLLSRYAAPSAAAASAEFSSPSAPPPSRFVWDSCNAVVVAADVVYPDTSDEALTALFQTVNVLLGDSTAAAESTAAALAAESSAAAAASSSSSLSTSSLPFPLRGSFVCAYVSRESDTSRRLLLAASDAGFEAAPVSRRCFDERVKQQADTCEAALAAEAVQGAILMFRRVERVRMEEATPAAAAVLRAAAAATASSSVSAPSAVTSLTVPSFMLHPSLLPLWCPAPTRAELALLELEQADENTLLAGCGAVSDDEQG